MLGTGTIYVYNIHMDIYFKLMRVSKVCDGHDIRHPTVHLPKLSHEFEEQLIQYQMIKKS